MPAHDAVEPSAATQHGEHEREPEAHGDGERMATSAWAAARRTAIARALGGVALVFPVLMLLQMMSAGAMGGEISSAARRAVSLSDTEGSGRGEGSNDLSRHHDRVGKGGAVDLMRRRHRLPAEGLRRILHEANRYCRCIYESSFAFR